MYYNIIHIQKYLKNILYDYFRILEDTICEGTNSAVVLKRWLLVIILRTTLFCCSLGSLQVNSQFLFKIL